MVIKSKKKERKVTLFFSFFINRFFLFFLIEKCRTKSKTSCGLPGKKYKQVNAEKNGSARRCL